MYQHTKFGIPSPKNIGDVAEVKVKVTPKTVRTLWHPNLYPQSKFGIPASTQCKLNALYTISLGLVSEDKVNVTVT